MIKISLAIAVLLFGVQALHTQNGVKQLAQTKGKFTPKQLAQLKSYAKTLSKGKYEVEEEESSESEEREPERGQT
jgi:threonyl-tRNA synthetase